MPKHTIEDEKLKQQFFKVIGIMDKAMRKELKNEEEPKKETMQQYFKRKGWK